MGAAESESSVWLQCAEGGEMSDTPETDHLEVQLGQAAMHSHPILWEHSRRMERERDKAREKIKRQAERIRKLEGATNHAGGLYK